MAIPQNSPTQYANFFATFAAKSLSTYGNTVDIVDIDPEAHDDHGTAVLKATVIVSHMRHTPHRTPVYLTIYDDVINADEEEQAVDIMYNFVDISVECDVKLNSKTPYNYADVAETAARYVDSAINAAYDAR